MSSQDGAGPSYVLADAMLAYLASGRQIDVSIDQDSGALTFRIQDEHLVQRFVERGEAGMTRDGG